MFIGEILKNDTIHRIYQEWSIEARDYIYWIESLSSSGYYKITEGFDSYQSALKSL